MKVLPGFNNCVELVEFLHQEANDIVRYPVIYILVKGLKAWQDLIIRLRFEVDRVINLSSLCAEAPDAFPYLGNLPGELEKYKDKKVLVLPLAECIRLNIKQSSVLGKLAQWQSVGKTRVYIPLLDLEDIYLQEMNAIARFRNGLLPETLTLGDNNYNAYDRTDIRYTVDLQISSLPLNGFSGTIVNGIKAYLEIWETGGINRINLVTQYAYLLKERMGNFNIKICKNSFEVVEYISGSFSAIKKEWGLENQWFWLAGEIKWQEDFNEMAARLLNVKVYDEIQLFALWHAFDENRRWLLWLWSKMQNNAGPYLQRVIQNCTDYKSFTEDMINCNFNLHMDPVMLKERVSILTYMRIKEMPSSYWQYMADLKDPLEKLKSLTGITEQEKEEIVLVVKELLEVNMEKEKWWSYLEISYPELASYLTMFNFSDELLNKYFEHYTSSKVLNNPKEEILKIANEYSREKKYWRYFTRDILLEKFKNQEYPIFWVDGMGLEWLGLLKGLFYAQDIMFDVQVARANLPTSTEFNKGWMGENEVERNLDDIAHKHNYSFPNSLIEQIEVIKKVVKKTALMLSIHKCVIITSDHGLTRFASRGEKITPPERANVHKWGRFARLTGGCSLDDIMDDLWVTDGDKVILAVHNIFLGGSAISKEVHGGATPEESLVPVIRLYKKDDKALSRPEFKVSDHRVKLNAKGEGYLIITAPVNNILMRVSGFTFYGIPTKGTNKWNIFVSNLKAGDYTAILEYDGGYLGEVRFKLIKGMVENKLGL